MKLEGLSVEMRTGFWWGNLTERDTLRDLVVDGDNIKMNIFYYRLKTQYILIRIMSILYYFLGNMFRL